MHPCLIVPTSELSIGNKTRPPSSQPIPIVAPSIIVSQPHHNHRLLDEKTGLAILTYVYDRKSLFYDDDDDEREDEAVPSFFVLPGKKTTNEQSFIEKSKTLINLYPRKDNIRFIDKWFLLKHKLTIAILLSECKVEISNLRIAGIVTTFDDLLELGFRLSDLVINRELFNVGHIVQLFGMTAETLNITLQDLLECLFLPAELATLQFSLPLYIEENDVRGCHIQRLGYDLKSLVQLGIQKKHLKILGITYPIALNTMKWHPKEVNQMYQRK